MRKRHAAGQTPPVEPQQNADAILIDLHLEVIDLFVISNGSDAQIVIASEQTLLARSRLRSVKPAIMSTLLRNADSASSNVPKNMFWCNHCGSSLFAVINRRRPGSRAWKHHPNLRNIILRLSFS